MTEQQPETPLPRFLTLADTAEVLSVSAHQVRELIRSGELPAIRVGASGWRIETDVLEHYIQSQYEASRRESAWSEGEFANVIDVSFGDHSRANRT